MLQIKITNFNLEKESHNLDPIFLFWKYFTILIDNNQWMLNFQILTLIGKLHPIQRVSSDSQGIPLVFDHYGPLVAKK